MKREDFNKQVFEEIENIKKKATADEISKLDFDKLEPQDSTLCIYGQMTGNCFQKRARELKKGIKQEYTIPSNNSNFDEIESYHDSTYSMFSPLEAYITLRDAKKKTIIQYIKGEINQLKPEDL